MTVDDIIENVLKAEGGYVNDPADRGGETNFGITVAVARANNYTGPMRDLPRELAKQIYFKRYVGEPKFDQVLGINDRLGEELIDTGVNMGPSTAATYLQRWLNGFNDTGSRYQDLFVDGRLGKISLDALRAFLIWRKADGVTALLRGLNGVQGTRYLDITERDKSQRRFLFGWMLNRVT